MEWGLAIAARSSLSSLAFVSKSKLLASKEISHSYYLNKSGQLLVKIVPWPTQAIELWLLSSARSLLSSSAVPLPSDESPHTIYRTGQWSAPLHLFEGQWSAPLHLFEGQWSAPLLLFRVYFYVKQSTLHKPTVTPRNNSAI